MARLEGVRFVLWGFPEATQTFIHREFQEMLRQGLRVQILAGARRDLVSQPEDIQEISKHDTIYLGNPVAWFLKGLLVGAFGPYPFFRVLFRMAKFPHKDLLHRLRALAMVVAAASVAGKVRKSGTKHLQAHFGSYPTEWAMALAWMLGITYGGTWHAVDIWKDANILAQKIHYAEVVFTCTKFNADHLQRLAGSDSGKVVLSYHGLDFSRLPEPAPIPETEKSIIAIGRLVPKKGFKFLLEALSILKDRGQNVSLTIVGNGPLLKELETEACELGLENQVVFVGSLSNAKTLALINSSSLLVAPSIRGEGGNIDGIPNVVLEAMALARPVIGSKISGIPEVVSEATGALVEEASSTEIADALAKLLGDRELLETRGRNALAFVHEHFDVRKNIAVQLGGFEKILSR